MKEHLSALSIGLGLGLGLVSAEPKVERKPFAVGALWEMGALNKGLYQAGISQASERRFDWIDHFGAFLTQEAVIDDRLFLSGGLGGIFQFRKPEIPTAGFIGHQRKAFFIGPTKAEAAYHFGDPAEPVFVLAAGMSMYKYNPDAWDLGEYLFRSQPYPTMTTTGGYSLINSAAANIQGFRSSLRLGAFKSDILLLTETATAPLYDWSLAAVASYSAGEGLLDLGAGINFKRLLQIRPSRTALQRASNASFEHQGRSYAGNSDYYSKQADFYQGRGDSARAAAAKAQQAVVDSLIGLGPTHPDYPDFQYYSAAGTLLMARASLDPKRLFGTGSLGPEDLKLYAEVGVLGVKDYPIYYEKIAERMPVMVGFNLPGFRVLDLIAVQVEHMNSPWLNNNSQVAQQNYNIPYFPGPQDKLLSRNDYNDLAKDDNWKWSVLVRKRLGAHLTLAGQVASNHLRLTSSSYYFGPQFDHNEVTPTTDYWYGMLQISWGI